MMRKQVLRGRKDGDGGTFPDQFALPRIAGFEKTWQVCTFQEWKLRQGRKERSTAN